MWFAFRARGQYATCAGRPATAIGRHTVAKGAGCSMERLMTGGTMGRTRRAAMAGATAAAGSVVFAACAPGGQGQGGPTDAKSKTPVTLKLNYRTELYIPTR